jgi:D-glycero-D-manno-heptose 1,7-bisphosphate phosphatase
MRSKPPTRAQVTENSPGRPAVFLDRDGTINAEVDYLSNPDDLALIGNAGEAIARLNRAGYLCVVITNQSGIARGILTEERLSEIHQRLDEMLAVTDARVDHYEFCPHHPDHGTELYRRDCDCRKPSPGMYRAAQAACGIDLSQSWAVGDSSRDLEAAETLGVPGLLVRTGKPVTPESLERWNVVTDISAAVDHILASGALNDES